VTKIRISLERRYPTEHVFYDGSTGYTQTIVREFEDEYAAQDWFINDSYFEESYTSRAVWERVDP
jgi:predicted nucleotide-binding protein